MPRARGLCAPRRNCLSPPSRGRLTALIARCRKRGRREGVFRRALCRPPRRCDSRRSLGGPAPRPPTDIGRAAQIVIGGSLFAAPFFGLEFLRGLSARTLTLCARGTVAWSGVFWGGKLVDKLLWCWEGLGVGVFLWGFGTFLGWK